MELSLGEGHLLRKDLAEALLVELASQERSLHKLSAAGVADQQVLGLSVCQPWTEQRTARHQGRPRLA